MNPAVLASEPPAHPAAGRPWDGEKLYFRGDDYFKDLLESIRRARATVDFETYIFEKGRLGDLVVSTLRKAEARGVQVRLLVDGIGSPDFEEWYGERLKARGVEYRVYRSWKTLLASLFGRMGFGLRKDLRGLKTLWHWGGHRDHRKLCVVDGHKVWVGSFNVSDQHLEGVRGDKAWRDTGIALSGVKTDVFHLAFHLAWEEGTRYRLRFSQRKRLIRQISHDVLEEPVRLNITRRLRSLFNHRLAHRLVEARKRIWITTPYFVPTRSLFKALIKAARKGCDVRFILPGPSDVPVVKWVSMVFYSHLLKAGCRIFEYQGRVLHAKSLFIDERAYVGSSNLNHRSLLHDLEIIVLPQKKASLKALEGQFETDMRMSREATLGEMKHRPFWSRMLSFLFFRFRYWF